MQNSDAPLTTFGVSRCVSLGIEAFWIVYVPFVSCMAFCRVVLTNGSGFKLCVWCLVSNVRALSVFVFGSSFCFNRACAGVTILRRDGVRIMAADWVHPDVRLRFEPHGGGAEDVRRCRLG